jgi:hypothetical protein
VALGAPGGNPALPLKAANKPPKQSRIKFNDRMILNVALTNRIATKRKGFTLIELLVVIAIFECRKN